MGKGHCGPHKVGGPYHVVETFVTKCPDGQCEYMENSKANYGTQKIDEWMECWICGDRKYR
jgi:hypothetical protein